MNDDVLVPCGGFLPVFLDRGGYIMSIEDENMVHRETREIWNWMGYVESFDDAKSAILSETELGREDDLPAILELTPEGGGAVLWTFPDKVEDVAARRDRWKGCYGAWPVRPLTV